MPLAEDMTKGIPAENPERAWLARLCDEANARARALMFSDLPAERQQYWRALALRERRWLRPGEELSPMCQAALAAPQGELFTPAELDAAMTRREKLDVNQ